MRTLATAAAFLVIASVMTQAQSGSSSDIPDVHAHAGAIEAGIRGSRRVVLSDAGHLMYLEKPDEFTRLVIGFIESNDAAAAN